MRDRVACSSLDHLHGCLEWHLPSELEKDVVVFRKGFLHQRAEQRLQRAKVSLLETSAGGLGFGADQRLVESAMPSARLNEERSKNNEEEPADDCQLDHFPPPEAHPLLRSTLW